MPFLSFGPFLAEKMALEVKKARFNPFVLQSDFFKADGDPVYPTLTHQHSPPRQPLQQVPPPQHQQQQAQQQPQQRHVRLWTSFTFSQ